MRNYTNNNETMTGIELLEGETIEEKIRRIVNNAEPITDGAPIIYTERKDGVQPQYNIRTDRWDIAAEAMTAIDRTNKAKRQEAIDSRMNEKKQIDGGQANTSVTQDNA